MRLAPHKSGLFPAIPHVLKCLERTAADFFQTSNPLERTSNHCDLILNGFERALKTLEGIPKDRERAAAILERIAYDRAGTLDVIGYAPEALGNAPQAFLYAAKFV